MSEIRQMKFRQPVFDGEGKFTHYHYSGILNPGVGIVTSPLPRQLEIHLLTGVFDISGHEIWENDYLDDIWLVIWSQKHMCYVLSNDGALEVFDKEAAKMSTVTGHKYLKPHE